jgi:hypothetical protein
MKLLRYPFLLVLVALCFQWTGQSVAAQHRNINATFQGIWIWESYLTDKDLQDPENIEIYKHWAYGQDMKTTPFMSLTASIWQKDGKLSGYCDSVEHFGDKFDDGDFTMIASENAAQIELQSSYGSKMKVRLTYRKNRLYWNVVRIYETSGDLRFPMTATLRKAFSPMVEGISIGSSFSDVKKALGKSAHTSRSPHDICGKSLELKYPGLIVELCQDEPKRDVWCLTITGKQWRMFGGLRIGITDIEVEKILGIPGSRSLDQATGQEVISYYFTGFDTSFRVYLSKYKVVKIEMLADQI